MLPGSAVPGSCLVSFYFLWAILSTGTVYVVQQPPPPRPVVHPGEMRTVALLAQIALVAFVIVTLVLIVFLVILCCFNVISTVRRKQDLR